MAKFSNNITKEKKALRNLPPVSHYFFIQIDDGIVHS